MKPRSTSNAPLKPLAGKFQVPAGWVQQLCQLEGLDVNGPAYWQHRGPLLAKLGDGCLDLLRFFLNHRRFQRSRHCQRVGRSPAELLTGRSHPHYWLELLGFQRFARPAIAVA